jgi:hypothetical protein
VLVLLALRLIRTTAIPRSGAVLLGACHSQVCWSLEYRARTAARKRRPTMRSPPYCWPKWFGCFTWQHPAPLSACCPRVPLPELCKPKWSRLSFSQPSSACSFTTPGSPP